MPQRAGARRSGRSILLIDRITMWARPCIVCGVPFDTQLDHIRPESMGGGHWPDNYQPLCQRCNRNKHNYRSNEDLIALVQSRGITHFIEALYKWDVKHGDRMLLGWWLEKNPSALTVAASLHQGFLNRICRQE